MDPAEWLCVYPFVRSYEWYLLPDAERGAMLRDHGLLGRDFPQVISNTVSSFALGDWEWILGLEAPELVDLVDLMRHLRATEARHHVREEIPFYTGRRVSRRRDCRGPRMSPLDPQSATAVNPVTEAGRMAPKDYDAVLLASFGGPEGQDDVIPFLRNVTRGRGIPDERLEEVSHHYRANGGISPINQQNRELKAAIEAELAARGIDLPVFWGNRNWDPYIPQTLQDATTPGTAGS